MTAFGGAKTKMNSPTFFTLKILGGGGLELSQGYMELKTDINNVEHYTHVQVNAFY